MSDIREEAESVREAWPGRTRVLTTLLNKTKGIIASPDASTTIIEYFYARSRCRYTMSMSIANKPKTKIQ